MPNPSTVAPQDVGNASLQTASFGDASIAADTDADGVPARHHQLGGRSSWMAPQSGLDHRHTAQGMLQLAFSDLDLDPLRLAVAVAFEFHFDRASRTTVAVIAFQISEL